MRLALPSFAFPLPRVVGTPFEGSTVLLLPPFHLQHCTYVISLNRLCTGVSNLTCEFSTTHLEYELVQPYRAHLREFYHDTGLAGTAVGPDRHSCLFGMRRENWCVLSVLLCCAS